MNVLCFLFSPLVFGLLGKIASAQILDASEVIGEPGIHYNPNVYPHITRKSFYNHLVPSLALGNAAFLFGALVGPKYFEYFKKAKHHGKKHETIGWGIPDYKYYHHQHDHDHYHHPYYKQYSNGWGWESSDAYSPYHNYYSY